MRRGWGEYAEIQSAEGENGALGRTPVDQVLGSTRQDGLKRHSRRRPLVRPTRETDTWQLVHEQQVDTELPCAAHLASKGERARRRGPRLGGEVDEHVRALAQLLLVTRDV